MALQQLVFPFKHLKSIAELRSTYENVINKGHAYVEAYTEGTGVGGGLFQWDSANTRPDDGGCIIKPTGVTVGRWVRQDVVNKTPEMFGAIGDGVTPDAAALQRMFNSANNYPDLADNFWGTFEMRHKYAIGTGIMCGRPIRVDAWGAEFIITAPVTAFSFSMHNGEWSGGYINYTTLPNSAINDECIAMRIAVEVSPIMFMASTITHVRVWGAHSGIVFSNPNTEIWGVKIQQCQLQVRSGSSPNKARGLDLNSSGGTGGSTTVRIAEVSVAGWGDEPGVGLKAYRVNVNDVMFDNIAVDGFYNEELGGCLIGSRDILDITSFRCEVRGLHTEVLINDTAQWSDSPIYFNTNSLTVDGVEMLNTQHTNHNGWVTLAGNGIAIIGAWHDLVKAGTKDAVLNLAFAQDDLKIVCTGNVGSSDIVGGKSRLKVSFANEPSSYGIDSNVTVTMDNANPKNILQLPDGPAVLAVNVQAANVASSDLGWCSQLLLLKVPTGGWVVKDNTLKLPNFAAATITYSVDVNGMLRVFNNSTATYQVQCKFCPGSMAGLAAF